MKRLAIAAALAATGCKAPDSSGLYEPASIRTDTPSIEASPGAAGKDAGAGSDSGPSTPNGEGSLPPGELPVSTGNEVDPPLAPPTPVASAADAGLPIGPSVPDAGNEPPPPPPPPPSVGPECAGTLLDGLCWYLGELDQACNGVCASHGGFEPASVARVGTPAQGGALESCAAVLEALGTPAAGVLEGFRDDTLGFGCHLFLGADGTPSAWWLTSPAFSPGVADPNVRLACACTG